MGPSETTGKNVRPTTMSTTPVSSAEKSGVSVGNVPADAGTVCLRARLTRRWRAQARSGGTGPTSIASPSVVLYQSVLPVSPPNAEPLLLPADVNAYVTSVSPCGPGLKIELFADSISTDAPANARTMSGTSTR